MKKIILFFLMIGTAHTLGCRAEEGCSERDCAPVVEDGEGEDACPPGELGCPCDDATCALGLGCLDNVCVEAECIPSDYPCYDNQDGELGFCCGDQECLGHEDENLWMCSEPCSLHSECSSGCCISIEELEGFYCSLESAGCLKCMDSCYWAKDGSCDDGGPGSDFSICELGTDCSDCGNR